MRRAFLATVGLLTVACNPARLIDQQPLVEAPSPVPTTFHAVTTVGFLNLA